MLPTDAQKRKTIPIATGVIDYFPAALAAVAELSQKGNDQHNPGQSLFWNREKSTDEADALMRHFIERGTIDSDGIRHSAKVAWRALALLQKELEAEGAPVARGAVPPKVTNPEQVEALQYNALVSGLCAPSPGTIVDSANIYVSKWGTRSVYEDSGAVRGCRCTACEQLRSE
jgi:hypothetical protein